MTRLHAPPALRLCLVALAAALATAACGDDSTTAPEEQLTIADLVGSWTASSAVFTNQADPSQQFDIVAEGGELRVTVLNGGGARTWLELGDFSDEWDAQLRIIGNELTSTPVESSRPTRRWAVQMEGDRLTLTDTDATFDFTLAGGAGVPATEVVVFVRN